MKYLSIGILALNFYVQSEATQPSECPASTIKCQNGGSSFSLGDTNTPSCWKKCKEDWRCSAKEGTSCKYDEIDVSKCTESKPPSPVCPPKDAICAAYSNSTYTPDDAQGPPCWYKTGDLWTCRDKIDGKCNLAFSQIDVATCYTPLPPNTPVCPKPRDMCLSKSDFHQANFPNAPPCWKKNFGVWGCTSKVNGACDASAGYSDVSTCLPPPGPLPCPQKNDTCAPAFNTTYTPADPNAPPCWSQSSKYWYCTGKTDGKCDSLRFLRDIATCQ